MLDSAMTRAWLAAGRYLRVRVVAPYELRLADDDRRGRGVPPRLWWSAWGSRRRTHDDERFKQASAARRHVWGLGDGYREFGPTISGRRWTIGLVRPTSRRPRGTQGSPGQTALSNKPLQQTNATRVRSDVGSCRDAAGYARGSSRPWYARTRPWRSLLNGRSFDRPGNGCRVQLSFPCEARLARRRMASRHRSRGRDMRPKACRGRPQASRSPGCALVSIVRG